MAAMAPMVVLQVAMALVEAGAEAQRVAVQVVSALCCRSQPQRVA